jgi:hypothetical protein
MHAVHFVEFASAIKLCYISMVYSGPRCKWRLGTGIWGLTLMGRTESGSW